MTLFCDLNGRIACTNHLGSEGESEYRHNPKARTLRTSMTVWERMTKADVASFVDECDIVGPACEACRYDYERTNTSWR